MKILKYIGIVILILVILFFAAGILKSELQYGHEIVVNKSIQEAWAVSEDPSKTTQWIDGLKSEELISGEQGAVGSKYKVIVNPEEGQEDFEMTETITSKKDYDHVSMEFDSEMMKFAQTMTFAEKLGKTTIKTESTVNAKGIMMRSVFALMEIMSGSFQKQEEKNINALKKVIEENTTDYFKVDSAAAE